MYRFRFRLPWDILKYVRRAGLWYAKRMERKGYELLDIAHMPGMSTEDHDLIEAKAYGIIDKAKRIRLKSYRI